MDAEPTLTSLDQQMPQAASPFEVGQVLDGKYEILSLLGKGGMGAVYRVRHILLNVELALKTLDTQRIGDASSSRRFKTEAKAAFSLKHPNLVKVHDFGVFEDGHPFLVMELVQGKTLQTLIKERGQLSLDEVESIFTQLCFGLASAHEQQVVHRDIKPANIMIVGGLALSAEGSVKILDFGIAKIVNSDRGEMQTLTQTGEIFGSPYYMSPEQCSGDTVDQRSDVYSLGCVLFEALTGTPPLVGANALRTMMLHVNEGAPTLKEAALGSEFPEGLESIVQKMLAKSSSDRYSNLGVVAHELSRVCSSLRKSATAESKSTESKNVISSASKKHSRTFTFSRVQLAMIVFSTAIVASLSTLCFDQYFNPISIQKKSALPSRPKSFGGLPPEYESTLAEINARTKLAYERISRISGKPVGPNLRQVVFPDEPIGKLYFGNQHDCPAKGTLLLPFLPAVFLEVCSDDAVILQNAFIFDKVDADIFTGLIFKGITKNSALDFVDDPAFEATQEKGAEVLFAAAEKWKRLDQLKLIEAKLTPSILSSINKMTLSQLHLRAVKFAPHLLEGSEIFKRTTILTIEHVDFGPILSEVENSSSVKAISFATNPSSRDIEKLRHCKSVETIAFVERSVPVDIVMATSRLKQVSNLLFQVDTLNKSQLKKLAKEWIVPSPPHSGAMIKLQRRT